jgi:hypothetical protein
MSIILLERFKIETKTQFDKIWESISKSNSDVKATVKN